MKSKKNGFLYSLPLTLWLFVFFFVPLIVIFIFSFMQNRLHGGIIPRFTLANFAIFGDKIFLLILWRTLVVSVCITFFTVVLAVPTSYFIARSKHKDELLLLITIPFWTNLLIRVYSWITVLGNNGLVNEFLMKIGLIDRPIQFLYNFGAVVLVSVYTSLPFAILPLYSVIEKFDFSLLEAARDLGATNCGAFFRIFIPGIKPGIITAILFTLVPSLGSYAIPKLVGGTNGMMLGNLIAQELLTIRNWPLASVISTALIIVTSVLLVIFLKKAKKEGGKHE